MDGILAIATTVLLLSPLYLVVLSELERIDSPAYLRAYGVIILKPEAVELRGEIAGYLNGSPFYLKVVFRDMTYEYDRLASPAHPRRVGRDELYLAPGLIYVFKK